MKTWHIIYDVYSFNLRAWVPDNVVVRAPTREIALVWLGVELADKGFSLMGELRNVSVTEG